MEVTIENNDGIKRAVNDGRIELTDGQQSQHWLIGERVSLRVGSQDRLSGAWNWCGVVTRIDSLIVEIDNKYIFPSLSIAVIEIADVCPKNE